MFVYRTATTMLSCAAFCNLLGCGGSSGPSGPTITSVRVSPTVVNLQVTQAQQFTATITGNGDFDHSVQWFVNDVSGGNDTVGKIAGGVYTAPAQPPNPATVTVKAVSTQDSSKLGSAQASIRPIFTPTIVWNETKLSLPGGDDGEATETPPGIAVADDGAGGAFVVWEHKYPVEVLAQHLDANGNPTWAAGGIPITTNWTGYQASPRAVSDGASGVIVVWLDGRAGFCDPSFLGSCDIYGQRLNATGALLWGATGKAITTAPNNQGVGGIAMIGDGAGGAILAYQDDRINNTSQGGSGGYTVYIQRVNANGDAVWPGDGIRIGQDPEAGDAGAIQNLKLISDGANGAIGAWYFTSYAGGSNLSLRSQRVSAGGQIMWGSEAVSVPGVTSSDPNGTGGQTFDLTGDGNGGAVIVAAWAPPNATAAGIFAQRLGPDGAIAWSPSGMTVSTSTNSGLNPAALADGSGGFFAAWQDCSNASVDCDIAMQHLNANGQRLWGQSQVYISKMPNQQLAPSLQPDTSGGVLVMWTDCRAYSDANSCYSNADVYAQDVDSSGNPMWQLNGYPLLVDPGNQGVQYYVYTPLPPVVSVRLKSGDILLAWPDGRNNICFPINPSTACELYVERFKF